MLPILTIPIHSEPTSHRSQKSSTATDYSHYVHNLVQALVPDIFIAETEPQEAPVTVFRRRQRQAKTRPLSYKLSTSMQDWKQHTLSGHITKETVDLVIPLKQNWTNLCRKSALNSKSRVLISGVLTQPLGQALALLLGKQCKVQIFLAVDPLYPNTQLDRLAQLDRYKSLKRALPKIELITPSPDPALDDSFLIGAMMRFQPTHLIHLELNVREYREVSDEGNERIYSYRRGLKAMNDLLRVQSVVPLNGTQTKLPKLVYVTSRDSTHTTMSQLQNLLTQTYHEMNALPIVHLELPTLYGPFIGEANAPEENDGTGSSLMYVDEAIASILRAFQNDHSSTFLLLQASLLRHQKPDLQTESYTAMSGQALNVTDMFRVAETQSWMFGEMNDHLGNAMIEAEFLDTYGVPLDIFPCASNCDSSSCFTTAVDNIQTIAKEVTTDCDYVLYVVDFSRRFDSDYLAETKSDDEADESEYNICRIAFVSSKSRLVRRMLLSEEDYEAGAEAPRRKLLNENGKHAYMEWTVVWIVDFESDSDKDFSSALLRIDPSGLFHSGVTSAMYTELYAFMAAPDYKLEATFQEMHRERIGESYKRVRRPGVGGMYKVLMPSQRARKVVFYAREPRDGPPDSLGDFLLNVETDVSAKQAEFYEDSDDIVLSTTLRNPVETMSSAYQYFPFQWISSGVFLHDFTMKHSQDFRCRWMKEFLYWGGSYDSELLSFAYLFGKLRLQGHYGLRIDYEGTDTSWIPLMNPVDMDERLVNPQDLELFVRIKEM